MIKSGFQLLKASAGYKAVVKAINSIPAGRALVWGERRW